ncbi:hypothetical protein SSBG_02864 [Streptomyces sp. SPB074]|nr:hypothetical protein SSBG_02864 [Streptomyces sp. SPB074]
MTSHTGGALLLALRRRGRGARDATRAVSGRARADSCGGTERSPGRAGPRDPTGTRDPLEAARRGAGQARAAGRVERRREPRMYVRALGLGRHPSRAMMVMRQDRSTGGSCAR